MLFKFTLWRGGSLALASIVVIFGIVFLHFHLILALIASINFFVEAKHNSFEFHNFKKNTINHSPGTLKLFE